MIISNLIHINEDFGYHTSRLVKENLYIFFK